MQPPQDDLSALPFLSVCPQCVLALPPDAKHCPRCGYRFEEQPEASEPGVDVPAAESGADAAPVETEEQPNIVASNPAVAPILGEPFEMPDFLATLQPGMFSSWREQAGALDQSAGETNPEPTQPHLQRATDLEPTQLRMQQAEAAPQSGIADAPTTPISPHIVQLPAGEGKAAEEKGEKTRTPDISRQQTRPTPRRQFIRFPAPAASARTQPGPNAAAASPVAPGALMSQGMGQQSNSAAAPVGTQSTLEHWLDIWWVRIPIVLRRYALMFSEAWCDGIYLTRYPRLACILPLLALLIGFIEGATHWTLSSIAGTIAFTELLPLMILTAIAGALSTNMGLMMIGGYMIGDFFIAAYQNPSYQVGAPGDFLNGVLFLRIPLLISYILLF
ncbi:MAG: hypothetical protein J2P36_06645, partial [Ktedonobacteraceae bacterium]|nr:hypothetical protein [Ktedonobacteraceae bacterium]